MSRPILALIFVVIALAPLGCNRASTAATPAATNNPLLSLSMLDGTIARQVGIQVGGQQIQATVLPKDLGQSALFLCYYTLPKSLEGKQASQAAVDAELDRCIANTGAQVLSRTNLPNAAQTTSEVVAKSPKNPNLSIRCRVISTRNEVQSLTAVTPANQDQAHLLAVDKMFEEFNGRTRPGP